jgi:hypothetical protein
LAAVALLSRHLGVSPSFCTRLLVVLLGICILFTLFFSVFFFLSFCFPSFLAPLRRHTALSLSLEARSTNLAAAPTGFFSSFPHIF